MISTKHWNLFLAKTEKRATTKKKKNKKEEEGKKRVIQLSSPLSSSFSEQLSSRFFFLALISRQLRSRSLFSAVTPIYFGAGSQAAPQQFRVVTLITKLKQTRSSSTSSSYTGHRPPAVTLITNLVQIHSSQNSSSYAHHQNMSN